MKLVSFQMGLQTRLGALTSGDIIDLNTAYTSFLVSRRVSFPFTRALEEMPPAMIPFLELGKDGMKRAQDLLNWIDSGELPKDEKARQVRYPLTKARILAPVPCPRKIIVVGLNYAEHVSESQVDIPDWPWTFGKLSTVLVGPGEPIGRPPLTRHLDGEVELAVIIGKRGKYISKERARDHVAGYSVFNDVSARNLQFEGEPGLRFFYLGKNFQDSAALGPYLVTSDEVPDPHCLDLTMYYNDRVIRKGNTRQMIFKVEELIAFYSRFFTVEPGDVISTGCPPAVEKREHHVFFDEDYGFLSPGDRCICEVQDVGVLQNPIVEASSKLSCGHRT